MDWLITYIHCTTVFVMQRSGDVISRRGHLFLIPFMYTIVDKISVVMCFQCPMGWQQRSTHFFERGTWFKLCFLTEVEIADVHGKRSMIAMVQVGRVQSISGTCASLWPFTNSVFWLDGFGRDGCDYSWTPFGVWYRWMYGVYMEMSMNERTSL